MASDLYINHSGIPNVKGDSHSGILIGAATSNSGKTTFTMGLLRALSRRGVSVQPFKCGPDYIDPMYHRQASGRESVNLDTFMSSPDHVRDLYDRYGAETDMRVVEGVMGLYDGSDKWHGSSAEIAMLLDIPVVLLVNAKSTAYSVAPLIHGFKTFTPPPTSFIHQTRPLNVAGVVFNMVASANHYSFLREACEDAGVECLGYMARNEELQIPSRHLGLTITGRETMEHLINAAADEVDRHVNIERIMQL